MPRAARAAAAVQDELGVDVELIKGRGGVFVVAVDGAVVARKGPTGFPSEAVVVDAVRAALGQDA